MRNWIKWLFGESKADKAKIRGELEIEHKRMMNEQFQVDEDVIWEREIRYVADKMMWEYDKEIQIAKIKGILDEYTPIVIVPPMRYKYKIWSYETARYKEVNSIHKAIMNRFNELKAIEESGIKL